MAQQINLYSPILLAPRRHFSARAMVQALALFGALLVAASGWTIASTASLRREMQRGVQAQTAERERLVQAIAARPSASGAALEQELAQLRQTVAQRQILLDELTRGRVFEGRSHAAVLRLVAQTVPPPVWLTELHASEGRLELVGLTLQPEALQSWLRRLAEDPLTAGQRLAAVKVERVPAQRADGRVPAGVEAWSFQLVSGAPTRTATSTAGGTP
jgi:Tfp pilus assembly protein PilN